MASSIKALKTLNRTYKAAEATKNINSHVKAAMAGDKTSQALVQKAMHELAPQIGAFVDITWA